MAHVVLVFDFSYECVVECATQPNSTFDGMWQCVDGACVCDCGFFDGRRAYTSLRRIFRMCVYDTHIYIIMLSAHTHVWVWCARANTFSKNYVWQLSDGTARWTERSEKKETEREHGCMLVHKWDRGWDRGRSIAVLGTVLCTMFSAAIVCIWMVAVRRLPTLKQHQCCFIYLFIFFRLSFSPSIHIQHIFICSHCSCVFFLLSK